MQFRIGGLSSAPDGSRTTYTLDELNNVREPNQQAINVNELLLPTRRKVRRRTTNLT